MHVSGPLTVAEAPGTGVPWATVTDDTDVHPFTGLVTVTVYVPATAMVSIAWFDVKSSGPVQL